MTIFLLEVDWEVLEHSLLQNIILLSTPLTELITCGDYQKICLHLYVMHSIPN